MSKSVRFSQVHVSVTLSNFNRVSFFILQTDTTCNKLLSAPRTPHCIKLNCPFNGRKRNRTKSQANQMSRSRKPIIITSP